MGNYGYLEIVNIRRYIYFSYYIGIDIINHIPNKKNQKISYANA